MRADSMQLTGFKKKTFWDEDQKDAGNKKVTDSTTEGKEIYPLESQLPFIFILLVTNFRTSLGKYPQRKLRVIRSKMTSDVLII